MNTNRNDYGITPIKNLFFQYTLFIHFHIQLEKMGWNNYISTGIVGVDFNMNNTWMNKQPLTAKKIEQGDSIVQECQKRPAH